MNMIEIIEKAIEEVKKEKAQRLTNLLLNQMAKISNETGKPLSEMLCKPETLNDIDLIKELGHVNTSGQEKILRACMINPDICPWTFAAEQNLYMSLNQDKINEWVDEVIKNNQKIVQDIKNGKILAVEKLVGQVMKLSNKGANPKETRETLLRKIANVK